MEYIVFTPRNDDIAVATLDMPGRPFNVFSEQMMDELEAVLEQACEGSRGLVICSGKDSFAAGADLMMIRDFADMRFGANWQSMRDRFSRLGKLFRRIEQAPIPVVAAVNGLALGGGLELAMACHGRVCIDVDRPILGLPEVDLGLLPGAGGTQRLPRLIGAAEAMGMLLGGAPVTPAFAMKLGLVDQIVSGDQLLDVALEMAATIQPGARWDQPGWQLPPMDRAFLEQPGWMALCLERGGWSQRQHDLYPAVAAICTCVARGARLPFDAGCDVEWDIFVDLMRDPVAANMVVTSFLNKSLARATDGGFQLLESAVADFLASSSMSAESVELAARAVDAAALVEAVGVSHLPDHHVPSREDRLAGMAMLGSIALALLRRHRGPHDQLDASAVWNGGWPQWTGGPIAFLAMLQRGEVSPADLPASLIDGVSAIGTPLKTGAAYSGASLAV